MDYNLCNFFIRTFIFVYRFVGMVSNSRTTRKSSYNCYYYDGNTCYQRYFIVLNKEKINILSFQAHFIRVIKFKTPKIPDALLGVGDFLSWSGEKRPTMSGFAPQNGGCLNRQGHTYREWHSHSRGSESGHRHHV